MSKTTAEAGRARGMGHECQTRGRNGSPGSRWRHGTAWHGMRSPDGVCSGPMAASRSVTVQSGAVARRARAVVRPRSTGAFAILALALAAPQGARAVTVDRVVATVDGQPITSHQLDAFLRAAGSADPAEIGETDRRRALDSLVNDMIVQSETQSLGISPSADEIDMYVEQIKKRNNLDDEKLDQALEAQGMTRERYREQVARELQRSSLVARRVKGQVTVTPEEVEKYFADHPEEFATAESVHVQHILFPFREGMSVAEAEQLLAEAKRAQERLQAGEKFEVVSREAAAGPGRAIGGDLGTMKRGQMVPVLDEAAFKLKEGEVGPPVRGEGGLHVLRVSERAVAKSADIEKVRDQIKEKLYAKALEDRYTRWVEQDLRKSHDVVIK
jgi:peptidyl-prolyl cis-trans isomerase SurA